MLRRSRVRLPAALEVLVTAGRSRSGATAAHLPIGAAHVAHCTAVADITGCAPVADITHCAAVAHTAHCAAVSRRRRAIEALIVA